MINKLNRSRYLYNLFILCLQCLLSLQQTTGGGYVYNNTRPSQNGFIPTWDDNGYLFFCLCMGRSGNQMEHFLGGLAFAKAINRTLVLPPFRTYRNVLFTEWFEFEPLLKYHRVILAEDFMEFLAPKYWPVGKRIGFCYSLTKEDCGMKTGNPFGPFWDGLGINFDEQIHYTITYNEPDKWNKKYPPEKYPVLALKGSPASYPMDPKNWPLQKYLVFSSRVKDEAQEYVQKNFPSKAYLGLHLRNGADWENACKHGVGERTYMASPQCIQRSEDRWITKEICLPSINEVLRLTRQLVVSKKLSVVFVATDKYSYVDELKKFLEDKNVEVYHADPNLPLVDWQILIHAEHFIGNCVSSFTSFVKRSRDFMNRPTSFWGMDHWTKK